MATAEPLTEVELDSLVVLRIVKHCREFMPTPVTGQLLGMDDSRGTLEVTSCFPFPSNLDGESLEDGGAQYQVEMMDRLREVNVDSNTVGWYQSTYLGSFLNTVTIGNQYQYQDQIANCVCLVYDPLRSTSASLNLKAYRLTAKFMAMYRSGKYTGADGELPSSEVFEELPVKVRNSELASAFLMDLEGQREGAAEEVPSEDVTDSSVAFLEKSLELMNECVDDLGQEQARFETWKRNQERQKQAQKQALDKRRAENQARVDAGEEPLPAFDEGDPLFKAAQEPNRLESLLISNQIGNFCKQISGFTAQATANLYAAEALAKSSA